VKIVSIVGARPQLITAAAVSRVLWERHREVLVLATVHRSENTDDVDRLSRILNGFNSLDKPVVFRPLLARVR
jgi:UDP-N-acetylglucosamine 2-epimerase